MSDEEHGVPDQFLTTVQSMVDFSNTIMRIRQAAEQNHAITLSPAECQSVIWAMRLLKAGDSHGEG